MVLAGDTDIPVCDLDYIGADAGALHLAQKGIHMVLALGDYDSAGSESVELIRRYSDEMITLPVMKDDSDSEAAIRRAAAMGYKKILVYGGLGGRIDHEIVNLRLAYAYPGTVLIDQMNRIEALTEGTHTIKKDTYSYVSFFAWQEAEITLRGMKYPLDHAVIGFEDLYTLSNEILDEQGTVTVHRGRILMICSRDRK